MTITAAILKQLIAQELATVADARVQAHVRSLLVEPVAALRDWDYGAPGQQYECWTVLHHAPSGTGIAYCAEGFGPAHPWGLVQTSGHDPMSIGMDSGWFSTFMDAYFDSFAATDLAIWRVFKETPGQSSTPISDEQQWHTAWEQIESLRAQDSEARYGCYHSITYGHRAAS